MVRPGSFLAMMITTFRCGGEEAQTLILHEMADGAMASGRVRRYRRTKSMQCLLL